MSELDRRIQESQFAAALRPKPEIEGQYARFGLRWFQAERSRYGLHWEWCKRPRRRVNFVELHYAERPERIAEIMAEREGL